jgi:hypothetical protein
LCGADIQGIEPDDELQGLVDRFIDGHARIKRSHAAGDGEAASDNKTKVIYEDVSMERGAFLVQQAMRVSYAQLLLPLKFAYILHPLLCINLLMLYIYILIIPLTFTYPGLSRTEH